MALGYARDSDSVHQERSQSSEASDSVTSH